MSWWEEIAGRELLQGDYLPGLSVPVHSDEKLLAGREYVVTVAETDAIVLTQSCDLLNDKAEFVALCPVLSIAKHVGHDLTAILQDPGRAKELRSRWERARRGEVAHLHLLAGIEDPNDQWECLVVDFKQIYSLPKSLVSGHAESFKARHRLKSPYLEHLSQSFARFFMRVGLPSGIAPFKK